MRSQPLALWISLIAPMPISEFMCSRRFSWSELSRIVVPCARLRYLFSSSCSQRMIATPSLSFPECELVGSDYKTKNLTELRATLQRSIRSIMEFMKSSNTEHTARPIIWIISRSEYSCQALPTYSLTPLITTVCAAVVDGQIYMNACSGIYHSRKFTPTARVFTKQLKFYPSRQKN